MWYSFSSNMLIERMPRNYSVFYRRTCSAHLVQCSASLVVLYLDRLGIVVILTISWVLPCPAWNTISSLPVLYQCVLAVSVVFTTSKHRLLH